MQASLLDVYKRLFSAYGPQGWWPARSRFEVIAGAILTQNTAWTNVEKAIINLKLKGALKSPAAMRAIGVSALAKLVRPAGYFNVKARRLKNFINYLFKKHGGSLARLGSLPTETLRRELLSVNGIGPETADSILLYAFRRPVFVVDAYTKRVLSQHGMAEGGASYDSVQRLFMDNLPRDEKLFNEYHALIVRLCKEYCKKGPRCGGCPLDAPVLKFVENDRHR